MLTTPQDLNLPHCMWSWACLDTPTLHEYTPQNGLRNGSGPVEVGHFVFSHFCPDADNSSVPQCASFSMILGSFGYPHTPWICFQEVLTKWFNPCGGRSLCIFTFLPICWQLLSTSNSFIFFTILGLFGYPHTLWWCSLQPLTKWLMSGGGRKAGADDWHTLNVKKYS